MVTFPETIGHLWRLEGESEHVLPFNSAGLPVVYLCPTVLQQCEMQRQMQQLSLFCGFTWEGTVPKSELNKENVKTKFADEH